MANNPMRYTDPTGHTISDVEQGMESLSGLVTALVAVGAAIQASIPLLLMPFLGFALGLVFYILIMTIVALMFMVIAEILLLLMDEFDHFQDDRPTDDCDRCDSEDLPEEPDDDCPIPGIDDCSDWFEDCDGCYIDCVLHGGIGPTSGIGRGFENLRQGFRVARALIRIAGPIKIFGVGLKEIIVAVLAGACRYYPMHCFAVVAEIVLGPMDPQLWIPACASLCVGTACKWGQF